MHNVRGTCVCVCVCVYNYTKGESYATVSMTVTRKAGARKRVVVAAHGAELKARLPLNDGSVDRRAWLSATCHRLRRCTAAFDSRFRAMPRQRLSLRCRFAAFFGKANRGHVEWLPGGATRLGRMRSTLVGPAQSFIAKVVGPALIVLF